MNCALIGTSRIAFIHLHFLKKRFKKIFVISRTKNKAKKFIKLNNLSKENNIIPSNTSVLNKEKFELIDICVHTNFHHTYLNKLKNKKALILIEKPIFSLNLFKSNYKSYLDDLYSKSKIIVCYPMQFLAKSFINQTNFKNKINKLEIHFYTNGKHKGKDICIDLIPHALSLMFELCKNSKFNIKKLFIKNIKESTYSWKCNFKIDYIDCIFVFKQNCKLYNSKFFFKINDQSVIREMKTIRGKFKNFLKFGKEKFEIQNPMEKVIFNAYNKISNYNYINANKLITKKIMKINHRLLYE